MLTATLLETTGPFRVLKYGNRGRVELASVLEDGDAEALLAGVSLEGAVLGRQVRMAVPNEQFEAPQFQFQPLQPVYLGVDGEIVQDTSSLPFVRQVGWAISEHVVWIEFKDVVVEPEPPAENPYPNLEDHQCAPIRLRTTFTFTVERDRQSLFLQPITIEPGAYLKLEERAGLLEVRSGTGGGGGGTGGAPAYQDIDELRAATPPVGMFMVYLMNTGIENDPQGGWFLWDSTSTSSDDGVDTVIPDSITHPNPGRYLRT